MGQKAIAESLLPSINGVDRRTVQLLTFATLNADGITARAQLWANNVKLAGKSVCPIRGNVQILKHQATLVPQFPIVSRSNSA